MSLTRHTPLRRTKPMRKWRRPKADAVTPALREAVLERDQGCVLARLVPAHVCGGRLTLEHVKDEARMGRRASSDMAHLVVCCYSANVETGETSKYRPLLRRYLAEVES